jgi:hypothetical protein
MQTIRFGNDLPKGTCCFMGIFFSPLAKEALESCFSIQILVWIVKVAIL